MTLPRLVAPRLDDPAADAGDDAAAIDPPVLAAIRCVYGVGVEPGAAPDGGHRFGQRQRLTQRARAFIIKTNDRFI